MGQRAFARDKKRAVEEGRTLLFVDGSGFSLLPSIVRTYAPAGKTPLLRSKLSHDHLSVIGAVSLEAKLDFQVHEHAITSVEVTSFLGHRLRHIPGKLLIVWDVAMIRRSKRIKRFLGDGTAARIHLDRYPGYAPGLDTEEAIRCHTQRVEMRNLCCGDLDELHQEFRAACQRLREKPRVIKGCLHHSGLV